MQRLSLILTPADVTVFRDSRPFEPGATGSRSEFPPPRAVAGAVRTWLLRGRTDFARFHQRRRLTGASGYTAMLADLRACTECAAQWVLDARLDGPFLCQANAGTTYYPAPLHLAKFEDGPEDEELRHAFPWMPDSGMPPPGMAAPDGAPKLDAWRPAVVKSHRDWELVSGKLVAASRLTEALSSELTVPRDVLMSPEEFYGHEPRFGIGMSLTSESAEEGRLYSTEFLRLAWEDKEGKRPYALRVDLEIPPTPGVDAAGQVRQLAIAAPWLPIGGEGRVAAITVRDDLDLPPKPGWPPPQGRFLTYLATPGLFPETRWYPKALAKKCELVSAITGTPRVLSGWDVAANRPLKTRYAVPAGAVHFWKIKDPADLPCDPHGTSLCDETEDQQAGWGLALRGEWNYV